MTATVEVATSAPELGRRHEVARRASRRRLLLWALTIVLIAITPTLLPDDFRLFTILTAVFTFYAALGVNLVNGYAGVFSIGQAAFAVLGGYTVAITMSRWDFPYVVATLTAVVLCALVGFVTAMPVLRLGSFAVAILTLLYLQALNSLILYYVDFTGGAAGLSSPRTSLSLDELWFVFAAIAAVLWLLIRNLILGPAGRAWKLGHRAPQLAQSLGIAVDRYRLTAFAIGAALGGFAGTFYPYVNGFIDTETITIAYAVMVLAMVVVGGEGRLTGPIWGVAILAGIPAVLNEAFEQAGATSQLVYGGLLILTAVLVPAGVTGAVEKLVHRVRYRRRGSPGDARDEDAIEEADLEQLPAPTAPADQAEPLPLDGTELHEHEHGGGGLELVGVGASISGVRALDDATFHVRPGTVHGLIGPNGAGKTTLLNCISGFQRGANGRILLDGTALTGKPAKRARRGLSRTFQQPALLDAESALENVLVGVDAWRKVPHLAYMLRLPPAIKEARRATTTALAWLDRVGLGDVADQEAQLLSPGQRRQLEIARALATEPRVLLMDEPAAGLTAAEIDDLGQLIRQAATSGTTVILIEHHAELVFEVCDHITVLDAGRVIADGTPDVVRRDPTVIAAYLGDELQAEDAVRAPAGD
jgi:ABC-type branched-subunit amino acid transport system ATPase component/ABC-type branched-subunit amino acid transport system permease subunit